LISHLSQRTESSVSPLFRFRSAQLLAEIQLRLVQPGLTRIVAGFSMNAPGYPDATEDKAVSYLNTEWFTDCKVRGGISYLYVHASNCWRELAQIRR